MAGKSYGNNHGRDNAFGLAMVAGPVIDFTEFGEVGVDTITFSTPDGREHAGGEERVPLVEHELAHELRDHRRHRDRRLFLWRPRAVPAHRGLAADPRRLPAAGRLRGLRAGLRAGGP